MSKEEKIVTFGCSDAIHVYTEKSYVTPAPPCKFHKNIFDAKNFLRECKGIYNAKVIYK